MAHLETLTERERRLLSQEVQEKEDFASLILDRSVDGIFTFDRYLRYTSWNPAMERLTGHSRSEVLGRHAFELFSFLRQLGRDRNYQLALHGQPSVADEVEMNFPGTGRKAYVQTQFYPLMDEANQNVGGLAIVRDTTERRLATDRSSTLQAQINERLRWESALEFLLEASETLHASRKRDEIARALLRLCARYFGSSAIVRLMDDSSEYREPERSLLWQQSDAFWMYLSESGARAQWVPYFPESELAGRLYSLETLRIASLIAVPLTSSASWLGWLVIASSERTLGAEEFQVATRLGRHAALALQNSGPS